ncbi:MAG: glycosyltransferase family 4 protein [Gammaproteobacteria bacterium]|nr:glycosyltransferase family 4 protein [Gammaproteobacteria bacterium]
MKTILISSPSEPDGGSGISTYAKEISTSLSNKGYEIHFLSPAPKDISWLEQNNITHVLSDQNSSQADTCRRTFEYIKEHSIDAIINNDNPVITSLAPALKCPVISVGHMEKRTIAGLAAYNVEWMDYIVAISNDMKQTYTTRFDIPVSKCPVIHNGLNKVIDHVNHTNNSKLKVIFAGQYTRIKGADLIVDMILTRHPVWSNIELNWYGQLPTNIEKKVTSNPNVKIHGRVPRNILMERMKESDIFLMASRIEGCPMAMLEAMSYGVVPITSNGKGAMQWLIDHGIHGYVCDLKNWPSQALVCLDALHTNRALLREMQKSVLNHFNENHLTDNTTDKLLHLLSNPTVDRSNPKKKITALKWHRSLNSSFIEKVCWRLGILRPESTLNLE